PPAVEESGSAGALLRDLYALLSFARHDPISLTTRGQIPKRTLTQIDAAFRVHEDVTGVRSESDLGRLPFLRALAEDAQLLLESARGLRLGEKALEFLARSPGRRQRQLYDVYRRTRRWSELTRLGDISVTPRDRLTSPGVVNARKRVLAEVAELPACQWIPAAHLVDRIRQRAFEFLVERDWSYSHYYYGSSCYSDPDPYWGNNSLGLSFRHRDSTSVQWDEVEGGFIRAVLEALHWLGVVDFGRMDAEGTLSLHITEAGAALLHDGTPQSAVPTPHVVVQPNFQIFAFEPTGEDVLFTLDRIAERVRVEQVVEYRLSRESVYAAQRDGVDIDSILDFLDRVSSAPLPQNVRRSLEEWGAQHERIVIQRGTSMVQTLDGALLDRLYDDPELRPLLGRRLTNTAALVSAHNLPTLHNQLVASATYPFPTVSEGDDSFRQPAVEVTDDGRIRPRHQLPSMYIVHALRQFADDVDGELRVTPAALRRAVGRDQTPPLTVEDIIATMERFQVGMLPEAVAALVRRWAKDWGRGALLEAALLQVESPEIMADLLADVELRPYLQPIPGTAELATIPRNRLERVHSLLRERGMRLGDRLFAHDGRTEKGG
ncbi:MAG TPA: helicase-associated domain-containing protein, partial [Chloroflexota bacterium]